MVRCKRYTGTEAGTNRIPDELIGRYQRKREVKDDFEVFSLWESLSEMRKTGMSRFEGEFTF